MSNTAITHPHAPYYGHKSCIFFSKLILEDFIGYRLGGYSIRSKRLQRKWNQPIAYNIVFNKTYDKVPQR